MSARASSVFASAFAYAIYYNTRGIIISDICLNIVFCVHASACININMHLLPTAHSLRASFRSAHTSSRSNVEKRLRQERRDMIHRADARRAERDAELYVVRI